MTTAARALETLITVSGVTKSELSTRSGVSRALIDDYLKGRRQPSVAQLRRLGDGAGYRMEVAWSPAWATARPSMSAPGLTVAERAQVLERVVPVAMEMRRSARAELEFPPFRSLTTSC